MNLKISKYFIKLLLSVTEVNIDTYGRLGRKLICDFTPSAEIERMMFAFGDAPRPLTASASLVEEIVHSQVKSYLWNEETVQHPD